MNIEEAIKFVNEHQNDELIKKYESARSLVLKEYEDSREKRNNEIYYKSSKKYDYFLVPPHKELGVNEGKWCYEEIGWDANGHKLNGKRVLYFCLSLCKLTEEQIKLRVERAIKEDNEEIENDR